MFVTVCLYSCECECMCKCSFTYIFGCLCLCMCAYRVCIFVLTRACAPSVAVAWGSQGRALFALSDTSHFAINYWHSPPIFSIPSYLSHSAPRAQPLHHLNTQTLKRGTQPMFPSTELRVRQSSRRREARWLKPCTLLLSRYSPCTSERWLQAPNIESSQLTYSQQINFTFLRASVSINLSLFHPLVSIALHGGDEELCHLAACQNNII